MNNQPRDTPPAASEKCYLKSAYDRMAARDGSLERMGYATALQHRTWGPVIQTGAELLELRDLDTHDEHSEGNSVIGDVHRALITLCRAAIAAHEAKKGGA